MDLSHLFLASSFFLIRIIRRVLCNALRLSGLFQLPTLHTECAPKSLNGLIKYQKRKEADWVAGRFISRRLNVSASLTGSDNFRLFYLYNNNKSTNVLPAGSYCMCFAFCDLGRVLLLPRVFYFLSSRPSRWGGGLNSRRDGYKTPMLVSMATPFSIRTRITDVHERKRRMRESPGNSPQRLLIAQSLCSVHTTPPSQ